ncbi:hypothetical protein [Candidatus Enterococcus clewellii]|uniref:IrrE N-terminal-like domain-containing protein n=1 Tax=Candidatus Enterococcus clewellii TaxID=1834193 RepID=A0A242K200_9ENTE|nr:hypothetical protein [Enterococcus sp. 9E7_DIV0242]OTP11689.1 hypothetical protein A5888_003788 [Enterococcus sp. 9E7_DIV0242]
MHFSDEFLGYLELKQDLLFHKIPEEKIPYYVNEALVIGRTAAQPFKGRTATELLAEQNISIEAVEGDGTFFKVKFRAQFEADSKGKNQILLYKQSLEELAEANQLTNEAVEEIVLIHEFFHFLEERQALAVPEQLDTIESFHFLGLARKAHIQRTSEIAANCFAKEVLGLEYLPSYYDYIFLMKTGELDQIALEEEKSIFERIFSRETSC